MADCGMISALIGFDQVAFLEQPGPEIPVDPGAQIDLFDRLDATNKFGLCRFSVLSDLCFMAMIRFAAAVRTYLVDMTGLGAYLRSL